MSFLWFAIGVIVGCFGYSLSITLFMTSGTLRIDHSNPLKDVYRFDVEKFDRLHKAKRVILNIDHNARLSQK